MAFTNRTTNYGLPQWVANDKPTWLSDVNGAFETIDTNLKTVADGTTGLADDINLLKETQTQQGQTITTLNANVINNTNSISTLQAKNVEQDTAISGVETIAAANTNKIGDTPLTTVAQTLTGAIEEIKNQPINNYSYDEIVVGKWVDGKTIYRKVIDFGAVASSGERSVPHNITNLDFITSITGVIWNYVAKKNTNIWHSIPLVNTNQNSTYDVEFYATNTSVTSECRSAREGYYAYVILEYTKTA